MATELLINLVSQFTGKGFVEAEKSVNKLQKSTKKLGKTLGVSLAAGVVFKTSKMLVKAFAEDEKAAVQLTKAVENLGIGFASPSINNFIEGLERTAAISRSELRPAFQDLLTTTGSLTKAQDLLNKSIIISRGSGIALSTVTEDLTKAYVGSTKGLEKYKTGFTAAEIASKSFAENLEILLELNQGAAEDYFTTTTYKLELLAIAGESAKITIGEGLVEGLGNLAGSGEASDAVQVIDDLAQGLKFVIKYGLTAFGLLARIPEFGFRAIGLGAMYDRPKTEIITETEFTKKQKELIAKLDAAEVKRAKALAALAKKHANAEILKRKEKEKQAKLDKAALALGKGEDVFDLDQIQIAAAILATQENIQRLGVNATDQQKLQLANDAQRLTVKQLMLDLEDAIAAKDVERATSLSKQLNTELAILGTLTGQTYKLGQIDKILASFVPKDLINLDNLDAAIRKLNEIMGSKFDFLSPIMPSQDRSSLYDLHPDMYTAYRAGDPGAVAAVNAHTEAIGVLAESELALADALLAESERALSLATASLSPSVATSSRGFDPAAFRMADNITINVNAGVIGSEDSVEQAVQKAILSIERKGDPLRYTGGL
jgi:hypothetical protein